MTRWSTENGSIVLLLEKLTNDVDQIIFNSNLLPQDGMKSIDTEVGKDFTIMEKAPTWAFSWLKAPTSAFTFKTL